MSHNLFVHLYSRYSSEPLTFSQTAWQSLNPNAQAGAAAGAWRQCRRPDGAGATAGEGQGFGSESGLDPDSIRSVDPDPELYSESGSGSRRAKMTYKS